MGTVSTHATVKLDLAEILATLDTAGETVRVEPAETIRPPRAALDPHGFDTLPTLTIEPDAPGEPRDPKTYLRLGAPLGEGGVGVVHLATQTPLRRRVAVKSLKGSSTASRSDLLREARITGLLEHPSIIPVYTLGQDPLGRPLLVMKRVEGESWLEQLARDRDPDGGPGRALARHVEVLMAVAGAVHFAHARGVVHRDLKPANVMTGAFGEVYVLDWGIALCRGEVARDLALGAPGVGLVGTPAYMAPEMVRCDPAAIDERTDVYLLGATLHHVLVGRPRHEGATLEAVLTSAHASVPYDYGPRAPVELVRLARAACDPDPAARPPSAAAFRDALARFLAHQSANELAAEAHARLVELEHALGAEVPDGRRIQELMGECRFGFQLALRGWPESPSGRAGQAAVLRLMVEGELARGDVERARTLVAELGGDAALEARVRALERARESDRRRIASLEQLRVDRDLAIGARRRSVLIAATGLVFCVSPIALDVALREGILAEPPGWSTGIAVPLGFALVSWWLGRVAERGRSNLVNRQFHAFAVIVFLAIFLHRLMAMALGQTLVDTMMTDAAIVFALVGAGAIALDRRVWAATAILFAMGVGIAVAPGVGLVVLGLGYGAAMGSVWWAWRGLAAAPAGDS